MFHTISPRINSPTDHPSDLCPTKITVLKQIINTFLVIYNISRTQNDKTNNYFITRFTKVILGNTSLRLDTDEMPLYTNTGCLKIIVFRVRGLVGDILLNK
jgi:hypothetical protein